MKRSLNPFKYRYHVFRPTLIQPAVWLFFFLGPVLNLLRVDMIDLRLIFFGERYPFEFKYLMWLPIGFYAGVLLIGILSVIVGRVFCGWSCPHNTMTEWTRPLRAAVGREPKPLWMTRLLRNKPASRELLVIASLVTGVVTTVSLSVLLSGWVVPLDWTLAQYLSGKPHVALVFGNFLFTLIGLFLLYSGHDFCRTCCPYGMLQSISAYQEGKWRPMEIRFLGADTAENCKSCTVCQQVCPVDIDPRKPENLRVGQFYGCFNCGECVDACKQIHSYGVKNADLGLDGGLLRFHYPRQTYRTAEKTRSS